MNEQAKKTSDKEDLIGWISEIAQTLNDTHKRVKILEEKIESLEKENESLYQEFIEEIDRIEYGDDEDPFFVEWKNEDFNFLNTKEDGNNN